MQKITPHLWFDKEAREAAEFYASVFPDSKVTNVTTLTDTPSGDCDVVSFALAGQPFMAISAGPVFKFSPAVSFHVKCGTKEEVDAIWENLSPGGKVFMPLDAYPFSERFGWLGDKFGVSWQVIYAGANPIPQKVVPFLMFTGNVAGKAEEAMNFYASVFKGAPHAGSDSESKAEILSRYSSGEQPDTEGTVRYGQFSLHGQKLEAMDSGHDHKFAFNEAISFIVPCDDQQEIDYFWAKLSANPKAEQCGWLKDKYGLSWQISPTILKELMSGDDKQRIGRVTQAFLTMKKFDIAALERAAAG